MRTYRIQNFRILPSIVQELRGNGFRAWVESNGGENVLCTNADQTEIPSISGWVVLVCEGLL